MKQIIEKKKMEKKRNNSNQKTKKVRKVFFAESVKWFCTSRNKQETNKRKQTNKQPNKQTNLSGLSMVSEANP